MAEIIRKYNIDPEKLHSFFVCNDDILSDFNRIYEQIILLRILSEYLYQSEYDVDSIISCTFEITGNLYNLSVKEKEKINLCNKIYSDMLGHGNK